MSEVYEDSNVLIEQPDASDPRLLEYVGHIREIFGAAIPWMDGFDVMTANATLLTEKGELVGGILAIDPSPESRDVIAAKERFFGSGGIFITCLYLKEEFRGRGLWKRLIRHQIEKAEALDGFAWGIVADRALVDLYQAGFEIETHEIKDGILLRFIKEKQYE